MKQLIEIVPDVNDLLALEPEEIGFVILQVLGSANHDERSILNSHNFMVDPGLRAYPRQRLADIQKVLMEGWMWLENEVFLARVLWTDPLTGSPLV